MADTAQHAETSTPGVSADNAAGDMQLNRIRMIPNAIWLMLNSEVAFFHKSDMEKMWRQRAEKKVKLT